MQNTAVKILEQKSATTPSFLSNIYPSNYSFSIVPIARSEYFSIYKKNGEDFCTINYPITYTSGMALSITKNIKDTQNLLETIKQIMIILNLVATVGIAFVSYLVSYLLSFPINKLISRLSLMSEEEITKLDLASFPIEFKHLALTINSFLTKIDLSLKSQKELFIGLAHELKTPLTVIKTKNSVTLLKPRDEKRYIETIKHTNKVVDEISSMTSSILAIGRSSLEQITPRKKFDISSFLESKLNDYELLINSFDLTLKTNIEGQNIKCFGTEILVSHVLQNFLQNAIRFSPASSFIELNAYLENGFYVIEVVDNGCGVKEGMDFFAAFVRDDKNGGSGLGLFLAKNAASLMNAEVDLQNRHNNKGAVAFIRLVC